MAEQSGFTHLPLPMVMQGRPKLLFGRGTETRTKQNTANRVRHGGYIKRRADDLSHFWKERRADRAERQLPHIETGIPILLEIDPSSNIDFLRGLGFEIVCEIEEGFIIVATDDVDMKTLNQKADDFIANIKTRCNSPAKVYALCEDTDRLKSVLSKELYAKWDSINANTLYLIDIGVSCCGNVKLPDRPKLKDGETEEHYHVREQRWNKSFESAYMAWDEIKMRREEEIERFVKEYGGEIVQCVDGSLNISDLPDSFSTRLKISGRCLVDFALNFAYIFEIAESEIIDMGKSVASGDTTNDDIIIQEPSPNSPIVCVIDSGVQEGHKYLAPAILSKDSKSLIPNDPDVSDKVDDDGHGTRVAGAILYPHSIPTHGTYELPFKIRNMRVLDLNNSMPPEIYPPKVIRSAVKTFNRECSLPSKIFNHSIGTRKSCELKHMTPWAAEIDSQSYKNDVLFIQAAGNVSREVVSAYLQSGHPYPEYLNRELCRISDPGQSLQALTVGSISLSDFETDDLIALGKKDELSSFSRSGPGIWDVIKPEVVEYGGTYAINKGNSPYILTTPPEVCPELIRRSPQGPAFARDEVGTSFSTPKVSYIAAEIEKALPNSTALLYRALIAQSARWPKREDVMSGSDCILMLRHIGYGVPDMERATHNNEYRVTLITPSNLEIGSNEAHVFRVPIPEELSSVGEDFDILVEVTLSYAASPRRTRRHIKGYLSTWVDWCCSRIGESAETFSQRVFETGSSIEDDGNFNWMLGEAINRGMTYDSSRGNGFSRKNSTLSKDWCLIKSNQLSDAFCIAVRGHKGWGEKFKAKYSLVVSFEAINQDVPIYEPVRAIIESEITAENDEIEIEMQGENPSKE